MIKNFFGRHLIEIWGFFVFNLFKTNAILEVLDSTLKLKSNLHNFWKKNKNFWLSNVDFLKKKRKIKKKGMPIGSDFFLYHQINGLVDFNYHHFFGQNYVFSK